jgi:hypothetical protein
MELHHGRICQHQWHVILRLRTAHHSLESSRINRPGLLSSAPARHSLARATSRTNPSPNQSVKREISFTCKQQMFLS